MIEVIVEEPKDQKKAVKDLTPVEMVDYLDRFIIGQTDAKKAVANALRNRWRRQKLPQDLADDIDPKSILMVGPTGCGKTEIARRLAKLVDSPFIKVEATKYTEVGFHGRDVDKILEDSRSLSILHLSRLRLQSTPKWDFTVATLIRSSKTREACRFSIYQG